MRVNLSSSDFGNLFEHFKSDAFRLETLDQYLVEEETTEFQRFLDGEALPLTQPGEWCAFVQKAVQGGKKMVRVHTLTFPLTPYTRYEVYWGYLFTSVAGEEISLLDRSRLPQLTTNNLQDFWIFDGAVVVFMNYDQDGRYQGAERDDDPQVLSQCRTVRDRLLSAAMPLREFLVHERTGSTHGGGNA